MAHENKTDSGNGGAGQPGRRGMMLVLSSPSGAGKSTIARLLLEGDAGLDLSVSVTSRAPRPGEVDGSDYHFIGVEEFKRMADEGALLEHAKVFDNYYGTPRAAVEKSMGAGRDVLFDIDWQGTQQLKHRAGEDLVSVFILPPSVDELERRLRERAQDSEEIVARRMADAASELSHYAEYDYIIINRDIGDSVQAVRAILEAERQRRDRQIGLTEFVRGLRESR